MYGAHCSRLARKVCDGTANTTTSAPASACSVSWVAVTVGGSSTPGQVVGVLAALVDRLADLLAPRPQRDVVAGVREHQ